MSSNISSSIIIWGYSNLVPSVRANKSCPIHTTPFAIIMAKGGTTPISRPKWGASPLRTPGNSIMNSQSRRKTSSCLNFLATMFARPTIVKKSCIGSIKALPGRFCKIFWSPCQIKPHNIRPTFSDHVFQGSPGNVPAPLLAMTRERYIRKYG